MNKQHLTYATIQQTTSDILYSILYTSIACYMHPKRFVVIECCEFNINLMCANWIIYVYALFADLWLLFLFSVLLFIW